MLFKQVHFWTWPGKKYYLCEGVKDGNWYAWVTDDPGPHTRNNWGTKRPSDDWKCFLGSEYVRTDTIREVDKEYEDLLV